MNEKLSDQVYEFSVENCPNGNLAKVAKFHTNPYNFLACLLGSITSRCSGKEPALLPELT